MPTVDAYLENLSAPIRGELQRVRTIVHSTVPEAEECISYGMPAFKYNKKYLIGYAAFADHMSVFPGSHAIDSLKENLADYKLSKGTIQFTLDKPLSDDLIRKIVLSRHTDIIKDSKN